MAYSFSFNGVDFSGYGLRVRNRDLPFVQQAETTQLRDRVFASDSVRPALSITLDIVVTASDASTQLSYLDSIHEKLDIRQNAQLKLDVFSGRYWEARFESMVGQAATPTVWEGTLVFSVHEPSAWANLETSSDYTVDADPKSVTEDVGGTGETRAVFTMACNNTLTDTDVIITNAATGEAVTWNGNLAVNDVLEIDCENMLVKLNGVADMAGVSGEFPGLLVGENLLSIAGFSGSLNIRYRERYI